MACPRPHGRAQPIQAGFWDDGRSAPSDPLWALLALVTQLLGLRSRHGTGQTAGSRQQGSSWGPSLKLAVTGRSGPPWARSVLVLPHPHPRAVFGNMQAWASLCLLWSCGWGEALPVPLGIPCCAPGGRTTHFTSFQHPERQTA